MQKVVSGRKLYEQVLEQIKSMIAQGLYKKGDLLPTEKELMEQTGVSRITVREALRLLSEAGVIATRRGSGSVVLLDRDDLLAENDAGDEYRQSFLNSTKARLLLEPSIAQSVAETATEEDIAKLEASLRDDCLEDTFHHTLVEIYNNPVVTQWMEESFRMETDPTLTRLIPPPRQKSFAAVLTEQHEKIFEAVRDHKPEFAYFYMKVHLDYMLQTYEEYFELLHSKF